MNTRPSDFGFPIPTVQGVQESGLDVPEVQKNFFYYFIITLYLVAIIFSLVVNSLLFFAFIKATKLFAQRPFLLMVLQIVFANLFSIISNLICGVPITLFLADDNTKGYLASGIYTLFNSLDTLSTWVLQIVSLMIAVHRFLIFMFPRHANTFAGSTLFIIIISTWIISLVVTVSTTVGDCFFKAVNLTGLIYRYHYYCGEKENTSSPLTTVMFGVDMIGTVGLPIISLLLYVVIFTKLAAIRKETGATSYGEKEMLKQAVAIFILYQVSNGIILIIHTTDTNASLTFLAKRINSMTWMMAGALAPLCLIISSKEIRKLLFVGKKKEQRTTSQPPPTITATAQSIQMRHSSHF